MVKNTETVCWICGKIPTITGAISKSKMCDKCADAISLKPIQPDRSKREDVHKTHACAWHSTCRDINPSCE